jgi:transposase
MAVTRDGIPVRVWCWPGNTADSALIRQVREDMRDWSLSRIIYAADRGFTSAENRRELMRGADGYILGEKLRSGSPEAAAALSRQGRYQQVAGNMQVKEVKIGSGDRFIVCYNPEQAARDERVRDQLVAALSDLIEGTDAWSVTKRAELRGRISTKPGLNRFLRVTPGGLLRIDKAKIAAEANLDGKYLLRTSDPKISAEDVALGYKQLLQVERGWRDMKSTLDLRPVFHRLEERIRAHVLLCWLALLLVRLAENTTDQTWRDLRREMQRLHAVTLTSPAGTATHTTTLTATQKHILTSLDIPAPARILDLSPTT